MLPDDWLYSCWEKKVVDCASIKLVVSIFMHCFHVGYHHHDIPGTLCQFIWEISFRAPESMRLFFARGMLRRGCQTVLALRHFTVGCFLPFIAFLRYGMSHVIYRLESLTASLCSPLFQDWKVPMVIPTPRSFKKVYIVGSDLKFSSSAHC